MQEDFLHFIWRYQKFEHKRLRTTAGLPLTIESPGALNSNSGPDFLNAKIRLDELLWNGPIELHLNASSWYHHQHQNDVAYDTVILHVVWEDDVAVSLSSGKLIPTLRLSDYVTQDQLDTYERQFLTPSEFIPCETYIQDFPTDRWVPWKERLFVERMEEKVGVVMQHLKGTENDWEAVFFRILFQGFGLNINGQAFLEVAQGIPFALIRKIRHDVLELEALFMGQAGLLSGTMEVVYFMDLKTRYTFLKKKYNLQALPKGVILFSRLRPANFPTIRLAQLAQLYAEQGAVFQRVILAESPEKASQYFNSSTTNYWKTHYNFGVVSRSLEKKLSPRFFDLILINTLLPIRFAYAQFQGVDGVTDLFEWGNAMNAEHNAITTPFKTLGVQVASGLDSQALLHLKKKYCDFKKCLSCALGFYFLKD